MARIRFNNHTYDTHLLTRLRWNWRRLRGVYDTPKPLVISHGMGCCDYWVTEPEKIGQAFLNDTLITKRGEVSDGDTR